MKACRYCDIEMEVSKFDRDVLVCEKCCYLCVIPKVICSACHTSFITNKLTLHCVRCGRWYCTNCWTEADDESWPTDDIKEDNQNARAYICARGLYGQFEIHHCDECLYGNASEPSN